MIGLAEQLRRLGQLSRNIHDEAARMDARDPRSSFASEVSEWASTATAIIGGLALDALPLLPDREEGAPEATITDPEAKTQRIPTPTDAELEAELRQHADTGQDR